MRKSIIGSINIKKQLALLTLSGVMTMSAFVGMAYADLATLPYHHTNINVSNSNGSYISGTNGTYYIQWDGGGLNQLHITTNNSSAGTSGQVTTINTQDSTVSGSFYVSTTGGRGYNDDIILLASVKGPISNDFSLSVNASGYQWTPYTDGTQKVGPDVHFVSTTMNETFTAADFQYGPQVFRPGTSVSLSLPFYVGQNTSDPSSAETFMFIDLFSGNYTWKSDANNNGEVKVNFTFSGLYDTVASFNAYAYAADSNIGSTGSINWSNNTTPGATNNSGYAILSTAPTPTPLPAAFWLLGSGLSGMFFMRRRKNEA